MSLEGIQQYEILISLESGIQLCILFRLRLHTIPLQTWPADSSGYTSKLWICNKFWHANSLIQQIFKPARHGFPIWWIKSLVNKRKKLCVIMLRTHMKRICKLPMTKREQTEWKIYYAESAQMNSTKFSRIGLRWGRVCTIDYIPLSAARNWRSDECVWSGFQRVRRANV